MSSPCERRFLPPSTHTDDRIRAFSTELQARVGNLPGVRSVGVADYLPMSRIGVGGGFDIEGRPPATGAEQPSSWISVVGGDYFSAMGIPLLRGRLPGGTDTEKTGLVLVIDEKLAQRYWPGEDPIGARVRWNRRDERGLWRDRRRGRERALWRIGLESAGDHLFLASPEPGSPVDACRAHARRIPTRSRQPLPPRSGQWIQISPPQ